MGHLGDMDSKERYLAEKLNAARSDLMLPFPKGIARAVADAFGNAQLGLLNFKPAEDLPPTILSYIDELKNFMNTDGVTVKSENEGGWHAKAETFTDDSLARISLLIDELATYFDHRGKRWA